jgi:hypothetical protein
MEAGWIIDWHSNCCQDKRIHFPQARADKNDFDTTKSNEFQTLAEMYQQAKVRPDAVAFYRATIDERFCNLI